MDVFVWLAGWEVEVPTLQISVPHSCSDTGHLTQLCQRQHNGIHFQKHVGDKSHLCSEKLSKHMLHFIFTGGFNTAMALTSFIPIVKNFIFDESINQMPVIETVEYKASFNFYPPYCPWKTMWVTPADCYVRSRLTVPLLLVLMNIDCFCSREYRLSLSRSDCFHNESRLCCLKHAAKKINCSLSLL